MRSVYAVFIAMTWVVASPASGHHGNIIFDLDRVVTLQGTVSRYVWRNPHVYIYVEASDDTGQRVEWQLEGDPTRIQHTAFHLRNADGEGRRRAGCLHGGG